MMTRVIAPLLAVLLLAATPAGAAFAPDAPVLVAAAKRKPAKRKPSRPVPPPPSQEAAPAAPAQVTPDVAPPVSATPESGSPAAPATQDSGSTPSSEPSLDFDLLTPEAEASKGLLDPDLQKDLETRRTMLKLHQGLGLAMAGGLTAATVLGQLQFNESFRGGGDNRSLLAWHRGVVIGTSVLFATVGTLGLLAPDPVERPFQWDTVTFHKIFMSLATAGMIAQAVLGILATHSYGEITEPKYATAHQVVGYATLGCVAAGIVTLTF
ncbi:hypothetical protein D7X55_29090 [Corallococcus sp. AB049A]|uniref:Cytochrome b561 domain-containing protein n=1 Tax=Corallococcus interemptor TaxID=2316720 RepID=A0A3A8Q9F9_9BACT|nr:MULTISPECIES: hypothetical protein [Corallococcus]RKH48896.1 hypothetical protein D7Y23_18620 [Corallococcus sp. AB050B]RKH65307.1 hypothetical protein D7X96_24020 [Corallococcus interemptor]RKI55860.1 hypothetical protein D7X55_29090 [Corallococcus sp. AB049A]